jgi:hypothetical protein
MDLHHLLLAGLPAHSGLPRETDIVRVGRHVSKVPQADAWAIELRVTSLIEQAAQTEQSLYCEMPLPAKDRHP